MTEKTLTTENIKPAIDALRGELAPWPVVAMKQDKLNDTQKSAVNSGITSGLVAQIIANTAAIRALESAITGTGLRPLVVASLPAIGTQGILYIVPVTTYDPATDADVVNYSNEYIWIVAPDAPVTEGYYEQVGQTGIVINNGQLTITVNGTSVGTFTANQAGDTTAAITVPTNSDYVDLTTAQTAAGVKTFSDGIVGNVTGTASRATADADGNTISSTYGKLAGSQVWSGTNSFHNLNPETNSTYSLGSSSYQWSSVYAQSYYYNGTEFSSKFVTTDTSQSISRQKTFNANLVCTSSIYTRNDNYTSGTVPTSSMIAMNRFVDKNNLDIGYTRAVIRADGSTEAELRSLNRFTNGALDPAGSAITSSLVVGISSTGSAYMQFNGRLQNALSPTTSGSYDCGTSTNKWKTLNGVNPGALSLPDYDETKALLVDTTGWTYDGSTANQLKINNATQTINGWLFIRIENVASTDRVVIRFNGNLASDPAMSFSPAGTDINLIMPIPANRLTNIYLTKAPLHIKLYPCRGNV